MPGRSLPLGRVLDHERIIALDPITNLPEVHRHPVQRGDDDDASTFLQAPPQRIEIGGKRGRIEIVERDA